MNLVTTLFMLDVLVRIRNICNLHHPKSLSGISFCLAVNSGICELLGSFVDPTVVEPAGARKVKLQLARLGVKFKALVLSVS